MRRNRWASEGSDSSWSPASSKPAAKWRVLPRRTSASATQVDQDVPDRVANGFVDAQARNDPVAEVVGVTDEVWPVDVEAFRVVRGLQQLDVASVEHSTTHVEHLPDELLVEQFAHCALGLRRSGIIHRYSSSICARVRWAHCST
jgi:hypothetical protein